MCGFSQTLLSYFMLPSLGASSNQPCLLQQQHNMSKAAAGPIRHETVTVQDLVRLTRGVIHTLSYHTATGDGAHHDEEVTFFFSDLQWPVLCLP